MALPESQRRTQIYRIVDLLDDFWVINPDLTFTEICAKVDRLARDHFPWSDFTNEDEQIEEVLSKAGGEWKIQSMKSTK